MEFETLTEERISLLLPPRKKDAHKGDSGRALLMAGSERFAGAARMAAAACLRGGAGITYACVPKGIRAALFALPEVIAIGVGTGGGWDALAEAEAANEIVSMTALGLGPGMGKMETGELIRAALKTKLPTVLDADALNHMAAHRELLKLLHPNVILTPHPGEMARLTQESVERLLSDPADTAIRWSKTWNCSVLFKGAVTHVAFHGRVVRNETGNPGLAKGGSGDVLTGLVLAFLAQGLSPFDAGCCGAYLLGCSADRALHLLGTRFLTARDVVDAVEKTIDETGEKRYSMHN